MTKRVMDKIDRTITGAARQFLGLPSSAPNSMATLEAGLPTAEELLNRCRYQLFYALLLSVHRSAPGPSLFHALLRQNLFRHNEGELNSWLHCTYAAMYKLGEQGAIIPMTLLTSQIAPDAKVFGQSVVDVLRRQSARSLGLSNAITMSNQRPTASAAPHQHYHELSFSLSDPTFFRGLSAFATSLSWRGQRGHGNSLSLVNVRVPRRLIAALATLRLGALALRVSPLAPTSWLLSTPPTRRAKHGHKAPLDAKACKARDDLKDDWRSACHGTQCPLCRQTADPWHVLIECPDPFVVTARRALWAAATRFLPVLIESILENSRGFECSSALRGLASSLIPMLGGLDWAAPDNSFLLYRLSIAMPWPAFNVPPDPPSVTHMLGLMLSHALLPTDKVRRIYNVWVPWAAAIATDTIAAWSSRVDSHSGYPPLGYGRVRLRLSAPLPGGGSLGPVWVPYLIPEAEEPQSPMSE
jgi:hypothetical protein